MAGTAAVLVGVAGGVGVSAVPVVDVVSFLIPVTAVPAAAAGVGGGVLTARGMVVLLVNLAEVMLS